jgi:transcriptional antiterminator RfaH
MERTPTGSMQHMREQQIITPKANWYVVRTRSRQESIAEANLHRQAFQVFLPRIETTRNHRGKWKKRVETLFPNYLFVRLNLGRDNISPLRSTRGVKELVAFGGHIKPVPDGFVEELQASADPGTCILRREHALSFRKGDEITVVSGPFAGYRGIFNGTAGDGRVAVLMEMLGRPNKVYLGQESVIPC